MTRSIVTSQVTMVPLLLAAAALVAGVPAGAVHAGPTFESQTVAADGMFNNRSTTAIDSKGVTHTAFMTQLGTDDSSKEIVYANNADGSWNLIQLTEAPVRHELPSLTIDHENNIHIAWHRGVPEGGNKIQYVNTVGAEPGSFNEIIDITEAGFVIPEIRVDSAGLVHFTFRSQTLGTIPEDVYYTTWSADDGVGPLVNISNTPGELAWESQIAIDSRDIVHMVYEDDAGFGGGTLKYLNNAGGEFEEIDTGVIGNVISPMLLISPEDVVSIIYRQSNVLWAIDDGGTGEFSKPEPLFTDVTALPAFFERFAIDQNGRRHVAFASNSGDLQGIIYIGETDTGWSQPVQIDKGDLTNLGTSIAVDADGQIVVTYSLSGSDGVVFADLFAAFGQIDVVPCPGDLTGDGTVGVPDLLVLIGAWGPCDNPDDCPADLTGDGAVGVPDLLVLISEWGPCP